MNRIRKLFCPTLLLGCLVNIFGGLSFSQTRLPDIHYEPTPQMVVEELLKMAEVNGNDVVYDLGCGDGRFVITAAQKYGARGVGIDIDPERIQESNRNARIAGVTNRVKFIKGDLFEADIREATVVALYLLPELNLRLRPKLLKDLRPGSRVVSHEFDMGDWQADKEGRMGRNRYFFWVVPAQVAGMWRWTFAASKMEVPFSMSLVQNFQDIEGKILTPYQTGAPLETYLIGRQIGFFLNYRPPGEMIEMRHSGLVSGDTINGSLTLKGRTLSGKFRWMAKRSPTF